MAETQTDGAGDKGGGTAVATGADWSDDVREIGDQIANLTLAQAVQLSTYLEEKHGIKPATSGYAVPDQQQQKPKEEKAPEQTEFSVMMTGLTDATKKLAVIKLYREQTSKGLKEAKDEVEAASDAAPRAIKESIPLAEANALKDKFEAAGAKITVK